MCSVQHTQKISLLHPKKSIYVVGGSFACIYVYHMVYVTPKKEMSVLVKQSEITYHYVF